MKRVPSPAAWHIVEYSQSGGSSPGLQLPSPHQWYGYTLLADGWSLLFFLKLLGSLGECFICFSLWILEQELPPESTLWLFAQLLTLDWPLNFSLLQLAHLKSEIGT